MSNEVEPEASRRAVPSLGGKGGGAEQKGVIGQRGQWGKAGLRGVSGQDRIHAEVATTLDVWSLETLADQWPWPMSRFHADWRAHKARDATHNKP